MHYKPTLTQEVIKPGDILYPNDLWCKSGHRAASQLVLDGTTQPMRFIRVSGSSLEAKYHGIYCEHCLIIANHMAKKP